MRDTPGSRPETALGRLRQEALAKEDEALRDVLKNEQRRAVHEVLADPSLQEILRRELTEQVVRRVSADVATQLGNRLTVAIRETEGRIIKEVENNLLKFWTRAAKKALDEGFERARADFAQDQGLEGGLKSPVHPLSTRGTGHGADLTISSDSEAPEYLYITYLALRELQP